MKHKTNLAVILFLTVSACAGSHQTETEKRDLIQKISNDSFGNSFQILFNEEKTFGLSVRQEKRSSLTPFPSLNFFLYDFSQNKIVFEDEAPRGEIRWKDSDYFEVTITPGIVTAGDENKIYGYIYNAKTGVKSGLQK